MLRLISSLGGTYAIDENWNASVQLANFSTNTRQTVVITLDSLSMVQTTKTIGGNLARALRSDNASGSITLSLNYQDAIVDQIRTTTFYNANLGWTQQNTRSKLNLGAALMAMHTISENGANSNIGPSFNAGRPFAGDKVQLNFVAAYLVSFVDGVAGGGITNLALNGNYF